MTARSTKAWTLRVCCTGTWKNGGRTGIKSSGSDVKEQKAEIKQS